MQTGINEKLFLQWNNFSENISSSFEELRGDFDFTDVTLVCEDGQQVDSHKMVLITSSPFFLNLLRKNKHTNPLIFMRGVKFDVLVAMVDFFYRGEANVDQENLDSFLALASELQLKGLEENQHKENAESDPCKITKERSPKDLKVAKAKPKAYPYSQEVLGEKYSDEYRNLIELPRETAIALSNQDNYTNLEKLDETVRSMMIASENRVGARRRSAKICTECGKEGLLQSITNHIESVHLFGLQIPCNICGKTVKSRQSLAVHKLDNHRRNEEMKDHAENI